MDRRRLLRTAVALVTTVLAATSCGQDGTPPAPGFRIEVDTVAGIETVRSYGEPPEWSVEPVFSLGGAEARDTTEEFGQIRSVVADGDGQIYVADRILSTVRQFGAQGSFVRTIGREGQGPGEYRRPAGLGLLGDTLLVVDPGNVRIGLFRHGEWESQWSYPALTGPSDLVFVTGAQELAVRSYRVLASGGELVYVRYLPEGPLDTIAARPQLEVPGSEPANYVECRGDGTIAGYSPPLSPRAIRAPAPAGLAVESEPTGYRLLFLNNRDDTLRIVERVTDDVYVDDAQWEIEVAAFEAWRREYRGLSCSPRGLERPERRRTIEGIYHDLSGRMWVEHLADAESRQSRFDVFAPSGELLAFVRTPRRSTTAPPFFLDDRIYLVTADSLDIQTVWALRVLRGAR